MLGWEICHRMEWKGLDDSNRLPRHHHEFLKPIYGKKAESDQCGSPRFNYLLKHEFLLQTCCFFQNRRYRFSICESQLQEGLLLYYR